MNKYMNKFSVLVSAFIGSTALFVILKAVLEKHAELPERMSFLVAFVPFFIVFFFAQRYMSARAQQFEKPHPTDLVLPISFFVLLAQYPASPIYGWLDSFGALGADIVPLACIGLLAYTIIFINMPTFARVFSTIIAGLLLFFVTQETTLVQNYMDWLQRKAELSPQDALSVALSIDVLFYGIIGFLIDRMRRK